MKFPVKFPVKIVSIEMEGGACPYQVEATTEDNQYFYLRYRHGRLRAGVSPREQDFKCGTDDYNVIDKIVDETGWAGWAHHDELAPLLEGLVMFPEGFRLESYPKEK